MKMGGFPYIRKKYKKTRSSSKMDKRKVKKQIIALSKKYKKMPTHAEFKKEDKMDLFAAMYVHFGGSRKCSLELNLKHGNIGSYKDFKSFDNIVSSKTFIRK